ncbi:MAG: hypothetical protein QOJ98_2084, partial [Acidobacteriota bacterium]|nr:hypothetical protein [Acidobacteriota bacterium]
MRPAGATFWRIGGLTGWQNRTASGDVAVSDHAGLRLGAAPGGPLSLLSSDGSFGGLTLPRGMALDRSLALHLLDQGADGIRVKRLDGETGRFVELPEVGGEGSEARRFRNAKSIAIVRDWLYVADQGNRRVQVFDLKTLVLVEMFAIRAVDLASHGGFVYILDRKHARVYRHAPYGRLELLLERDDRAGKWSRIAIDREGTLYFLNDDVLETRDPQAPSISDPGAIRDRFDIPPIGMDEQGRFLLPASLAIPCGRTLPDTKSRAGTKRMPRKSAAPAAQGTWLLYVVRRKERRVDAYSDGGRRRRHCWTNIGQPADVAACGDVAFILDEETQTVYRHAAGREPLTPSVRGEATTWSRIACDAAGNIYLLSPGRKTVQVFDCGGQTRGETSYAKVAALFQAARPGAPEPVEDARFNRHGEPASVDLSSPSGTRLHQTAGLWQSKPFDSEIASCQWHRIELELSGFPPGSAVSISTCAHEDAAEVAGFIDSHTFIAPVAQDGTTRHTFDCLVQSGVGRFLSVRIALRGDGFSTPAVDVARVHYPRDSYLQYLPATFSADDEGRVFLERYLAIFQTEWDALERVIDESERFFDPDAVPGGAMLEQLAAQWLALPLEAGWTDEQKRRLVSAVPKIYPHRGKLRGLSEFLAVYLANLSGLSTEDVKRLGFPAIVEGFRERELSFAGSSRLGSGAPLWSAAVARRLQLGVFAREGEVELVSTGDPVRDPFAKYAHRFRVFVPSAWVGDAASERMLRRAIE